MRFSIPTLATKTPTYIMGKIILNKNQRKIAPPIAAVRFLKIVEKNSEILRKTRPINIVDPIKIR